jgi:hypothetical protein
MSSTGAPGGMEPARLAGTLASGGGGLGAVPVEPLHAEAMTTRSVTAIREMPVTDLPQHGTAGELSTTER